MGSCIALRLDEPLGLGKKLLQRLDELFHAHDASPRGINFGAWEIPLRTTDEDSCRVPNVLQVDGAAEADNVRTAQNGGFDGFRRSGS